MHEDKDFFSPSVLATSLGKFTQDSPTTLGKYKKTGAFRGDRYFAPKTGMLGFSLQ
jgi:hypothetical protein